MHARLACLCNERERNEHGTNTALPKALDRQLFCAKFFLVPFFWIDICNNSPHFSWPGRHSFKFGYLKEKLNRESSHIFTSFCLISSPSNLAKHRHHSTKTFFWHLWVLLLLSTIIRHIWGNFLFFRCTLHLFLGWKNVFFRFVFESSLRFPRILSSSMYNTTFGEIHFKFLPRRDNEFSGSSALLRIENEMYTTQNALVRHLSRMIWSTF